MNNNKNVQEDKDCRPWGSWVASAIYVQKVDAADSPGDEWADKSDDERDVWDAIDARSRHTRKGDAGSRKNPMPEKGASHTHKPSFCAVAHNLSSGKGVGGVKYNNESIAVRLKTRARCPRALGEKVREIIKVPSHTHLK